MRVRKDGNLIDISVTISPVKDADGRIIGASKVARDITERKQSEKALLESEERFRTLSERLETTVSLRTQQLELRNTEVEQRNGEVLDQREQLRELSIRLVQSQDEERRRIARDLHDSAGQIITAICMDLASIGHRARHNEEIVKAVGQSREMVRDLGKEIRTISYLLHPPLLDETGLENAIHWYVQGLAERSGLKIHFDIPKDFGRLPDDLEVTIFRLVQECVTNIHRHSGSKMATIQLSRNLESVFLKIKDNGTGISDERLAEIRTQRSGVGTMGMRERVRHLRGTFDIRSNSGGTTISVKFPVSTPAASTTASIPDPAVGTNLGSAT